MLEAYKNFWLGYLDFYGRTKRPDYWWVVLINGIIGSLIFLLMDLLGETRAAGFTLTAFILFIAATALLQFLFRFVVCVMPISMLLGLY